MDTAQKQRLVAALGPIRRRVRTDTCWVKEPGQAPRRIDGRLDDARLARHVNGGPVYGAVPIAPGATTTLVAVLDFDSHGGETNWDNMVAAARGVADVARAIDLTPLPFRSTGGRGIHMYFVWSEPQDAYSVRTTLRSVLQACRFRDGAGGVAKGQVEVFPKQDEVAPGRFGNMFILPLGGLSVPLLGDEMRLGEKGDVAAWGPDWPQSDPVPVTERPARVDRPRPEAGDLDAGLERLAGALEALPNEDLEYEAWLKVILSAHEASGGSEEGRALARAWSMKSAKHCDEVFDRNVWDWASGAPVKDKVVPAEYVYGLAARGGWVDPWLLAAFPDLDAEEREARERARAEAIGRHGALEPPSFIQEQLLTEQMLERLIYIADGARVAMRDAPALVLPFTEASRMLAASVNVHEGARGGRRLEKRIDLWLADRHRLTVHTQTFAPGQGEFCYSPEGAPAQNLWQPRERRRFSPTAPEDWRERAQPFFDHVAYLAPNEAERERFLDWLAHAEQRPGTLPQTHYLMIAHETGIGRNWLSYALAQVWAGYVAIGFDLAESMRNGFNGGLSKKILACVDELHEAGTGPEAARVGEKLKSMLTEKTRMINPKYGRQHTEFNCCRFLMFSNHDAALPLAENDRRVIVIQNPALRRDADYYDRLYKLIDDPTFIGSVIRALQVRDISGFNPGAVAPMSVAKMAVVNASRNEIVQALRDLASTWGSDCITAADLKREASELSGIDASKLGRITHPAQQAGLRAYSKVVKVEGRATRVWILRNPTVWSDAKAADLAAEVLRGGASTASADGFDELA